jgi:tetratricopeptide (TPR) repeat protein
MIRPMPASGKLGTIICQRCLAANSLDDEFCARCGTRLMLVVEPTAARFEGEAASGDYEEHLLERVSALENHLLRFAEKLEKTLDLLARQARTAYIDHALLDTLISALGESGVVSRARVERMWREAVERDAGRADEGRRRAELKARIKSGPSGRERAAFAGLVEEGFGLIETGKRAEGFRALERAAALAPSNAPLHSFIGEHFFRERKAALAREYLSRAHAAAPDDRRACLLLGLVCGDEGEGALARSLLEQALSGGENSFAAHYALGRLHAAESDWAAALAEFKSALAARACPEAHYAIGLVHYQAGRYRTALRQLQSALKLDEDYAEAHYLVGLTRLRLGERRLAAESFAAAEAAGGKGRGAGRRSPRGRLPRADEMPPPQALSPRRRGSKRLVTGGDARIAEALRRDALGDSFTR